MRTTFLFLFILIGLTAYGQDNVKIDLVLDDNRGSNQLSILLKSEIQELLAHKYNIQFNELRIPMDDNTQAQTTIQTAINSNSDLLITLGFVSSSILGELGDYPKPCMAGISLSQGEKTTSGIDNFTFIESPFSIEDDLSVFKSVYDFKHLAVFVEPVLEPFIEPVMNQYKTDFDIQLIPQSQNVETDIAALNDNIDAVYYLPFIYDSAEKDQQLIDAVNDRKIASFSLFGRSVVELGALASLSSDDNIQTYARRMAINTMKMIEGQNPKDFAVRIESMQSDFTINVETMKAIGVYPDLEIISTASLVKLVPSKGKSLTLEGAVARALEQNINFQSQKKDIEIQAKEIEIAKSNILPQLTATTTLTSLDKSSAELLKQTSQATPQTQWAGNLQLSQVIYSEPALANIAIQKMLKDVQESALVSNQLDLVLDVSTTYISYLLALENMKIQNENVSISKKNLNIAKNRVAAGTSSKADVYGLESQLAVNNSSLNDAMNTVEQAKISLNTLLNFPLDEELILEDVDTSSMFVFIMDERIADGINNQQDIRNFTEYLVRYAMQNFPLLEQIKLNIKVTERSLLSNKRSNYLPQVSLQANLDKTFGRYGTRAADAVFEPLGYDPYQATYNIGGAVSLPIFQGNLRKNKIQQSELNLQQLQLTEGNTKLQIESSVRSALENLGNTYNQLQFAEEAERASNLFLQNIQNLYREGTTNINTLLDAQNSAIFAKLNAVSAQYNLFINALILERSIGMLYLLSNSKERDDFVTGFLQE